MLLLNYMHIGLQLITEKLMAFMHVMAYFLTTRVQEEERPLLQENY